MREWLRKLIVGGGNVIRERSYTNWNDSRVIGAIVAEKLREDATREQRYLNEERAAGGGVVAHSEFSVKVDIGDVFQAFIAGCREARANPTANEEVFERGDDAYVKLLIERADDSIKG